MNSARTLNPSATRRQVLGWAWVAGLLALGGQAGLALIGFLQPAFKEGGFGSKVKAGRVSEFAVGSVSHVQSGRFYLSRLDTGFLAMYQRCTHLGCTVPWISAEDRFHCPCHGAVYNKKGEVETGPPPRPLDLFPIVIEGEELIVDTSRIIERDRFDPSQVTRV
ncbi:MAG: hypothetical protein A2Z04_03510 [Chloroflexi bacterium RBG_16_57_9]|nr:MAG: hypothetical protein A2Z04_03510 [Chloroflexi bacterium RBG_16_57_9]